MNKLKTRFKKIFPPNSFIYRVIRKIFKLLSSIKRRISNFKYSIKANKASNAIIKEAQEIINSYPNAPYLVFYHPQWLGVANSTKGLFNNRVPLEALNTPKQVSKMSAYIQNSNAKLVIFSQIVDGWIDLIKDLKKAKPEITIRVIWHANNYEVISDYTWALNKEVIALYHQGIIDSFAFVKKSMVEYYNNSGIKAYYLINNVAKVEQSITEEDKKQTNKPIIGLYNVTTRELKNAYTQLAAIKSLGGIVDLVPSSKEVIEYCNFIGLEYTHVAEYIPTEALLKRIRKNTINLYVTFTECSPMFPIESFEVGIPCLVGNNNDYFDGEEIGKYVIISREDDIDELVYRMKQVISNRAEIVHMFEEWKDKFDQMCKENVEKFTSI